MWSSALVGEICHSCSAPTRHHGGNSAGRRQGVYAHPFLPFHPQVSFPDVEKAEWLNKVKEEGDNVFIFAFM